MDFPKINPVRNVEDLKGRVEGFFKSISNSRNTKNIDVTRQQLSFDSISINDNQKIISIPRDDVQSFIDLVSGSLIDGDLYLFGGIIRDLAIFGREGFNSDIDIVLDGDWSELLPIFHSYGAKLNKFGGYRLFIDHWPIDIWEARNTWAIKEGYIKYDGISSLTETTVLNWDGILMNWRTKNIISRKNYFEEINNGILDVVLPQNPNPLGMLIRILRHLRLKNASTISIRAVVLISKTLAIYDYQTIKNAEIKSYGKNIIDRILVDYFRTFTIGEEGELQQSFVCDGNEYSPLAEDINIQQSLF